MDAFDIFKKLSKGATFSKNLALKPIKKTNINVKTDDVEIKLEKNEHDLKLSKQNIDVGAEITLLSSLKPNKQRKGKKRKLESEQDEARKVRLLEEENINHYRNVNNIHIVGKRVPAPARTFSDFDVEDNLIVNVKKCGYTEPTPIQQQAVPIMLQGRQLLACAPTGSGKTAAFLLPIINQLKAPLKQGFRALILCPTRELAKQTQKECVRLSDGKGLRVHIISKIKKALEQYGSGSSQKFDILITTPNRLCYLLKQDPPAINLTNVEWLVVDEADKLFESGNRCFREQLEQILGACTNSNRKIAMFSATYTPLVAKWSVHNMKKLIRVTVGQRNAATDLVEQELLFVGNEQGKLLAFRDLVRKGLPAPVLIFVQSKERAQQLFNELIYDGINVDAIHADRTQTQRDNTVKSFREGKIWVLICTELMARGIDFKGVNLVINYDFPSSSISYVHRIGRAGRAGRKGKAITFFTTDDVSNLRSIAHVLKGSGCDVPQYMLIMKKKSKKDKKFANLTPHRDDIATRPTYEIFKQQIKRRKMGIQEDKAKTNQKPRNKPKLENDESKIQEKLEKKQKIVTSNNIKKPGLKIRKIKRKQIRTK